MDVERVVCVLKEEKNLKEWRDWVEKRVREGLDMSRSLNRLKDETPAFVGIGADGEGYDDGGSGMGEEQQIIVDEGSRRSKRKKI